ncbi:hypothetical protein [Streptomyces cyaneofuscatus]|uniref:Hydrogenase expression protein HypF n=1 Tax=Streptomyces cyaneofuscatus TaxID=66883 RepID=A0ABZ1F2L9_9ACTN|nr:hypothetical protein [Streptomyces cyaneofuscatus]WSB10461.1 hypothetical protein OG849_26040 [Streptomyces cyaneofuscatus]WSD46006.1 hypothetical protein OG857_09360 [Streptomyces cyaneofuscatus]WTA89381.1 hypothetical protein OG323_10375 [Streptomyces cyaneofuscatus]
MRGDDQQQPNAYADELLPVRKGPRHAAPKKSLLTKLHLPSGKKALALAAMPTAVFVGMGLTPKLAMADGNPDIPFAPGPCVTRSDEPDPSASESESPKATPTPSATPTDEPDKGEQPGQGGGATPKPTESGTATEDPAAGEKPDAAGEEPAEKPADEPSPTPTPTKSKNPLDPLGLGDALKDLFDPDKGKDKAEEKPEETASPSPSPTADSPKPADKPKAPEKDAAKDEAKDPANDPAKDASDKAKEEAGKTADAIREAAEKAGKDVKELDDDVKGLDPKKDEDIPDGAKPRFPCPEPDPEALAAASLEPGIPLLPADPWILESSLLTLNGLDYKGIVEVKRADGSIKKVLKFTASSIDIKDLHQLTVGPAGTTGHVKSRPGSTSTIRNGTVTMYTEELKGNLFGLIPITFNPQTPPPLNVPFAFFTKVKVTQAGQFGGTLTVPGLKNYLDGGRN